VNRRFPPIFFGGRHYLPGHQDGIPSYSVFVAPVSVVAVVASLPCPLNHCLTRTGAGHLPVLLLLIEGISTETASSCVVCRHLVWMTEDDGADAIRYCDIGFHGDAVIFSIPVEQDIADGKEQRFTCVGRRIGLSVEEEAVEEEDGRRGRMMTGWTGEVGGDMFVAIVGSYSRSRLKCISSQFTIRTQITRARLLFPFLPSLSIPDCC